MANIHIETDYLVVGAGASGMAFVDTLLSDSDANIVMVDQLDKPGGHWNNAYPFVTLHQPSAFYGVSSRELGDGSIDAIGFNKGLAHLASGAEVCAYFDDVMRQRFLPSGRVRYFPLCDYVEDGTFKSRLTGNTWSVASRKRVDATYYKSSVPATHTPSFEIDPEAWFMPLNDLPSIDCQPDGFVIIGGGKTAIDACLWLLEHSIDPGAIKWIRPRDAWLIDRKNTQPTVDFFADTLGAQALQFEAIAAAESIEDMFDRLESAGVLLRIDTEVRPKMFHGATISKTELDALRTIRNVFRMGHVKRIEPDRVILGDGEILTSANTVHVDCSASAISNLETTPIFQGDLITLQTVRSYQPVFSASFIAHIEATRDTEAEKNQLCGVVPLPNHDTDWIRMMIPYMMNQYQWSRDPELRSWLKENRLDGFSKLVRGISEDDTEKQAILQRLRDSSMPAMAKLQQFEREIPAA